MNAPCTLYERRSLAIQIQGRQSRVPNATGSQPGDLPLKNPIPKLNAYTLNSRQFGTRSGKRCQRLLPTNKHLITDEFYMISCGQKKCNLQLSGQFGGVRQCIERHYGLSKNIVVSAKPYSCQIAKSKKSVTRDLLVHIMLESYLKRILKKEGWERDQK